MTTQPSPKPSNGASPNTVAAEGTLYVSQPYRSSSNKLRAMVTFAPRKSHFDISNESSTSNEFRGFFTLCWISLFLFTVRTYIRSIETYGYPLDFEFASMFSRDAITLAISDAVLVLNTALCVPFAKAIAKGWIRYYWFDSLASDGSLRTLYSLPHLLVLMQHCASSLRVVMSRLAFILCSNPPNPIVI